MFVTREKNLGVVIGNNDLKIIVANDDKKANKLDEFDIVITNKDLKSTKMVIGTPGEYEVKGVLVNANSDSVETNTIHYAEIILDTVTFLYCFSNFKFSDDSYREIEDVDVLIVDQESKELDLAKLVNRFDPEIFVMVGDAETGTQILTEKGLAKSSVEKKIKFKPDDFGSEDFIIQTYILE